MEISFLKPCPFCGEEPATANPQIIEPGWWTCSIICGHCPAQIIGEGFTKDEAIDDAILLWNRRH